VVKKVLEIIEVMKNQQILLWAAVILVGWFILVNCQVHEGVDSFFDTKGGWLGDPPSRSKRYGKKIRNAGKSGLWVHVGDGTMVWIDLE